MSVLFDFEPGLIIWQIVILLTAFLILGRYAWKPILHFIHKQEEEYAQAARRAEEQMQTANRLKQKNIEAEKIAKQEVQQMIQQALLQKKQLLAQAEKEAQLLQDNMLIEAEKKILIKKQAAVKTLKSQVGNLTIQVAEKLLKQELSEKNKQDILLQTLIKQASTSLSLQKNT